MLERAGDLTQTIIAADPLDKAALYQQLGLKLTFYPQKQLVEARVIPEPPHVRSGRVRGGTRTKRTSLHAHRVIPAGEQVIDMADHQHADESTTRCIRMTTVICVAVLAAIAALVSFGYMRELALRYGEAGGARHLSRSAGWHGRCGIDVCPAGQQDGQAR